MYAGLTIFINPGYSYLNLTPAYDKPAVIALNLTFLRFGKVASGMFDGRNKYFLLYIAPCNSPAFIPYRASSYELVKIKSLRPL